MVNIASAPSRISAGKPSWSCGGGVPIATASGTAVNSSEPSASIAPSLNSDSNATASTNPRLCSVADARRVPNSIVNTAITRPT